METKTVIDKGILFNSRIPYEIVRSDKSAVTIGNHFILNLLSPNGKGEILTHEELSDKQKGEALTEMLLFLKKRSPSGTWMIGLNGPGLVSRPTFHVHGIVSEAPGQILRLVFNTRDWLRRLIKAIGHNDVIYNLAEELNQNLK